MKAKRKPRENEVLTEILAELRAARNERAPSVVSLGTHEFNLTVQNHSLKKAASVAREIYEKFKADKNIKRTETR